MDLLFDGSDVEHAHRFGRDLLGRTAAAVEQIRAKIDKRDPRTLSKLGYDPNKQEG